MLFIILWHTSFWCAINCQLDKNLMRQNQFPPKDEAQRATVFLWLSVYQIFMAMDKTGMNQVGHTNLAG